MQNLITPALGLSKNDGERAIPRTEPSEPVFAAESRDQLIGYQGIEQLLSLPAGKLRFLDQ